MSELLSQSFRGESDEGIMSRRERVLTALRGEYMDAGEDGEDDEGLNSFLNQISDRVAANSKKHRKSPSKASPVVSKPVTPCQPFLGDGILDKAFADFAGQVQAVKKAAEQVAALKAERKALGRVLSGWDRLNDGFATGSSATARVGTGFESSEDAEQMLKSGGLLVGALMGACDVGITEGFFAKLFAIPANAVGGVVASILKGDNKASRIIIQLVRRRVEALARLKLPIEGAVLEVLIVLLSSGTDVDAIRVADKILTESRTRVLNGDIELHRLAVAVRGALMAEVVGA